MIEKRVFFKPETTIELYKPVFYIPDDVINSGGPVPDGVYFRVVTDKATLSNYRYYAGIIGNCVAIGKKGGRWIQIWEK